MCLSVIFQHETCYYCGALRFGSSQKFLFTNFELTKSQTCWCFLLIPVCTQLDRSYRNKNLAFLCFKGTLVLFTASRIRALVFPLIHVCCAQLDRQQSSRDKADEGNSGVGCYLLNKYNCARAQWRESKASISSPSNVDKSSVPFWPAHSSHLSQVTSVSCEGKLKAWSSPVITNNWGKSQQPENLQFHKSDQDDTQQWRLRCFVKPRA